MKKIILIIPVLLLFLVSCTITQTYHFNKDFSGNSLVEVDASTYVTYLQMSDSTANYMDTLSAFFSEAAYYLNGVAGISNVKWDASESTNKLFLSFDFAGLIALNSAIENDPIGFDEITGGKPNFKQKGKQLSYYFGTKGEPLEDAAEYESMKDMFNYQIKFSFDHTINKAQFPGLTVSDDKHDADYITTLFDVPALDPEKPIVFKLK